MDNDNNPVVVTNKRRINSKTIIILAVIVLVIVAAIFCRRFFIAATVNGSVISKSSVVHRLEKQYGKQVLESFIAEKIINEEADKKGIKITKEVIDAEIQNVETQIKAQGQTLDEALKSQGLTMDDLRKQITIQKKLEALLADKMQVSDEEIQKYITDNKITVPYGKEVEVKAQIKVELSQQKLNAEALNWINQAKTTAKIKYYGNY